jgi:hypothetical protein
MRAAGLIAVAIVAAPLTGARAGDFDIQDLYHRTEALVRSLIGPARDRGREVIAPPRDIDSKMAFEPSRPAGTMRVIRPVEPFQQRH